VRVRRTRASRGAALIELAFVMPVVVGVFGLGFFAAHVYEVRSDLQRTAQRTAEYAASRCDPLAAYSATSGCYVPAPQSPPAQPQPPPQCGAITSNSPANGCYRTDVELAQFATTTFFHGTRTGCFALNDTITGANCNSGSGYDATRSSACSGEPDKLCKSLAPNVPGPKPNQRISITLRYKLDTPFAGPISLLGFDQLAVHLRRHGEATVE